ncbi:hypothetical protein GF371_05330 [Candidatus Woesearchaeota archaeon]|nr:hypothetical protein [Candidatus Woesearchaeota archaeon]
MNPLLFYSIILVLCLFIISKSADYAIGAVIGFAKKTGVSEFIIGFIIVSIGTSIPEFSTAVMASFAEESQLLLGDLIGASIIVVGLVLSFTVMIAKKIKTKQKRTIDYKTVMVFILVLLSCSLMLIDGYVSRIDAAILLFAFCAYLIIFWKKEEKISHMKKEVKFKKIWQDIVVFGGCIAALLLAARWLVVSAVEISDIIGIPKYIIGLLVIAIGTSIPELTVNIKTAMKGKHSVAFGNVFGSIVANITLILAIAALIRPFKVPFQTFGISIFFLLGFTIFGLYVLTRKEITLKQGIPLLACYLAFVAITILRGF